MSLDDALSDLDNLKGKMPLDLQPDELIRVPRRSLTLSELESETTLGQSGLRDHLCCVICSGIIQNCVVIKTCLHRFCSNCIEKCFRSGIRECPQCRKHVPSKRFLHHDSIFDSIITTLLPNVKLLNDLNDSLTLIKNKKLLLSRNNELLNQRSFFCADLDIIFDSDSNLLDNLEITRKLFSFKENCNTCKENGISIDPFADNACNCNYIRGLRGILSLLDDNQKQKEFRRTRMSILNSQPLPPPCGLIHFRLCPRNSINREDYVFFEFLSRSNITLRSLSKFLIAKFSSTHHCNHFTRNTKYITKEHEIPFSHRVTLAYIRNVSYVFSHDTLVIYYYN